MEWWSISRLMIAEDCGEAHRRRYVERERLPSTWRALRGSQVHDVAAKAHGAIMETGSPITVEEARDLAATGFDARIRHEGVTLNSQDVLEGAKKVLGRAKDYAVAMSAHYVGLVAPRVRPVAVELPVELAVDSTVGLRGRIDLVERFSEDDVEREVVPDLKTSTRTPPADTAHRSSQLTTYALMRRVSTGKLPDAVRLDYVVRTPTGRMSHVSLPSKRSEADVAALIARFNVAVEATRKGVFVPNTTGWRCSERWCEFWTTCRFVSGGGR